MLLKSELLYVITPPTPQDVFYLDRWGVKQLLLSILSAANGWSMLTQTKIKKWSPRGIRIKDLKYYYYRKKTNREIKFKL